MRAVLAVNIEWRPIQCGDLVTYFAVKCESNAKICSKVWLKSPLMKFPLEIVAKLGYSRPQSEQQAANAAPEAE
jgi:hypothetical protein